MLIKNWKHAWKFISMQAMAAALILQLGWDSLPESLKQEIPHKDKIAVALLILGILGRLKKQKSDGAE